jgi:hypothetical protein
MRLEGPTIVGLGGIPMTVLFTAAVLVFSAAALVFSAAALVFSAEAELTPTGCSVGGGGDSDVEGWLVVSCSVGGGGDSDVEGWLVVSCSVGGGGDSDVEGWPVDGLICPNAILVQYPIAAMQNAIIVDFKIISIIVLVPQIM